MFLGRHTCLPWFLEDGHADTVPLLAEIGGAPPYVLLVGDRRRAARVLAHLDGGVDLAARGAREIGEAAAGRVAVGVGRTGDVPVMVVETQMGGPATEIIVREVLDASFHPAGAQAAIRVGSCGVLDGQDPLPELAVAGFATGWSAAIEQSKAGVVGGGVPAGDPPIVRCTPAIMAALEAGIAEVAAEMPSASGGVYSKDSLYAEAGEAFGAELRRLGCIATEMELSTIGPVAGDLGVPWGGVMASAGFVPKGPWFGRERTERNEGAAIDAALAAVRGLAR